MNQVEGIKFSSFSATESIELTLFNHEFPFTSLFVIIIPVFAFLLYS